MIPGFQYLFKGPSVAALPDGKLPGLPQKLIGPEGLEQQGLPKVIQAPTNEPLTVTNTRLRSPITGQYIPTNPSPPGIPVAQVAPPGATIGAPTALGNNVNNLQQLTRIELQQMQTVSQNPKIPIPPTGPIPALVELAKGLRDKSFTAVGRAPILYGFYRLIADPGPQVGGPINPLFPFEGELSFQMIRNANRAGILAPIEGTQDIIEELREEVMIIQEATGVMHARDGA